MDHRIEAVAGVINKDLGQTLSADALAREVNLSSSQFHLLFRAQFGISPMRYVHSARMVAARDLLETSFLSVKQIMYAVGFNDSSHFLRDFKQLYGLTPTGYRKVTTPKV
jgi:transcriptional regulator GlxA family with amidase domain